MLFHVDGQVEARTFLVNIGLPNGVIVRDIEVAECQLSSSEDVLIGMDIITMGDFVITNVDGQTRFLFQSPSNFDIERVIEDPDL